MGSLCSKPGTHSGGHTVLGSSADTTSSSRQAATSNPGNPRSAAAEAAERRMKAAQERGTNTANPNRGKLAAQANKPAKFVPEERQEERLVWD